MLYRAWLAVLGVILCAGSAWSEDPFLRDPDQRLWKPVADDVYLQELGSQIQTDRPILSVAHYDGTLYALTDQGGYRLDGQHLERVPELSAGLQRLRVLDDALWAMGSVGLYRMVGDRVQQISDLAFVDVCLLNGVVHAATTMDVYRYEQGRLDNLEPETGYRSTNITFHREDGTQVLPQPERMGPLIRIAAYSGFIEAPTSDDPDVLGIEDAPLQNLGAAPYSGPPRPK